MERVFILGAGASRELNFNIIKIDRGAGIPVKIIPHKEIGPLSSGYFYYMNKLYNSLNRDLKILFQAKVSENLMEYIKIYFNHEYDGNISEKELLQKEEISKKVNIEKLYIFLEEKILEEKENGKNLFQNKSHLKLYLAKSDLIEYIHKSLSFISYYCNSNNYKFLSEYITRNGGNIISFNWDILFEEAMIATGKWTPKDGYGINFNDIIYKNEKDKRKGILSEINSNNFMLKPHGSINWYSKDDKTNDQILFIQLNPNLRSGNFCLLKRYEKGYYSSIVPPGIKRKSFPKTWNKMKNLLEQADEIIAIGFSFNDNDKYIKGEFSGIRFKKDLKIILINPENERLRNIYIEVFCTDNIEIKYKIFSEYCQLVIKQKEM